jgi:hypothetical protein
MKTKRMKVTNADQWHRRTIHTHHRQSAQYFNPDVELVAPDLYDGWGNTPDHIVGQFAPFSSDLNNPNFFDEISVPFDTSRGIGCWVNSTHGDNVTSVPAVECVLIANFRYADFPKSSANNPMFVRDSLVQEMMRQFHETYPANARRTFVSRSAFEQGVFVWPDYNRGPNGISFAVAFAVPQLHEHQIDELNEVVQRTLLVAVAEMLLRIMIGVA